MDTEEYLNEGEIYPWFDISINLPRYVAMASIFKFAVILSCIVFFWQTYLLLIHLNVKYFEQYFPAYLATVYLMISLVVYIECYKIFSPHVKRFKHTLYWSINMASDKTKEMLFNDHIRIRWTYTIQLIVGMLCTCLNTIIYSNDYKHYVAFSSVIVNNFPEYSNFIHNLFLPIVSLSGFPMIAGFWYMYYMLLYFKSQIYMLIDKFSFLKFDNVDLRDEFPSKDYNEKVKKCLTFYLKRHRRIIGYLNFISENGKVVVMLFIIGNFCISAFTVCTVFLSITGLRVALLCTFVYFMCLTTVSYELQLLHDSVHDLSEAFYNLNWYMWNNENMKIYRTIHLNISQERLSLPIPSFIDSNLVILKSAANDTSRGDNINNQLSFEDPFTSTKKYSYCISTKYFYTYDGLETIEYVSLTADRLEEAILVLQKGFFPYENVCIAIGLASLPDAIEECNDMLVDIARHGVSLVAVDSQTGKIVGVALNKIQHKSVTSKQVLDQYYRNAKCEESKSLFELMAQLEDNMDPFTPYNADCLLELVFIGVLPEYWSRGIGYQLANVTVQLATLLFQGENVKTSLDENDLPLEPRPQVITSLFTTYKSQNIGRKLNFEVQQLVSYDELFYKSKSYRSILGNDTKGITCECRQLR